MFSVALIGPDGSGKSLISKLLVGALSDLPVKRVYMGINLESSNLMLPTTRLLLELKRSAGGRPDMAGPFEASPQKQASKNPVKWILSEIKAWALLANRVAEEWFRQLVAWVYQKRGNIVLFDRHFFLDFYFYDMAVDTPGMPLTRRIHGFLLKQYYPRPDLVVYLDAPAELLYARKREGTIESIERRRSEYLSLCKVVPAFEVVDASQPVETVVAQAADAIRKYAPRQGERNRTPLPADKNMPKKSSSQLMR